MNLAESGAIETLRRWRQDPILFVKDNFKATPDDWQEEFLLSLRDNQRTVASACKGPGKSCGMAWGGWWFLACFPQAKGFATAITGDNLRDNLWSEFALWQKKSPFLSEFFQWQSERIFCKESPETWFLSTRQWSKQSDKSSQANTLAGLHGLYTIVLIDEAGDIPPGVTEAADASLSTGKVNRILMTGNPTRTDGPLYDAVKVYNHMWKVIKITGDPANPKRSKRIDPVWAQQKIDQWGRDNPWVMINVLGEFPPAGATKLIGPEVVDAAFRANPAEALFRRSARVLGVDVARFGDDKSIIFPRQGLMAWRPRQYRNLDHEQLGEELIRYMDAWEADAAFVDVGGMGIALVDWCHTRGFSKVHGVNFGSKAADDQRFVNRRAEMYWDVAQFLKNNKGSVALPKIVELKQELCAPNYDFDPRGRVILDAKDDIKENLQRSPDLADGYALTFASPVKPRFRPDEEVLLYKPKGSGRAITEYDPFKEN
jgi:hypothetical protein